MEGTEERTADEASTGTPDRPDHPHAPRPVTRRRLLTLGALGVAAAGGTYAVTQAGGIPSLPDVAGWSGLSDHLRPSCG